MLEPGTQPAGEHGHWDEGNQESLDLKPRRATRQDTAEQRVWIKGKEFGEEQLNKASAATRKRRGDLSKDGNSESLQVKNSKLLRN